MKFRVKCFFSFFLVFFLLSMSSLYAQKNNTKKTVISNVLENQLYFVPQDPSFLYETRYIPGIKNKTEFLSTELEKEIIVERIEDKKNNKSNFTIKLPKLNQAIVFGVIILIFTIYRIRIRKIRRK